MFKPQTPVLMLGLILPFMVFAQLYEQQFSTSLAAFSNSNSNNGTYVNAPPSNTQLTYLGSSGIGSVVEITGGKLNINRTGNGWGFARGASFAGPPASVIISFDLEIISSGGGATSAIVLAIGGGSDIAAATTSPVPNTDAHSRISFNYTNVNGEFVVRDIAGSVNGPTTFTGSKTVFIAINNSGSVLTYKAPDGTFETVDNDKFDVWVGASRELNERDATTASQTLEYVKCTSTNGTANISIDNILIDPIPEIPTPLASTNITTSSFTANWNTVAGVTGYRIDVATDSGCMNLVSGYANVYVSGQSTDQLTITGLVSNSPYFYHVRAVSHYTTGELAGGNSLTQSVHTSIGGLPVPALIADTLTNTVDDTIDIPFADDETWRTAITMVKVNGVVLTPNTDYEINTGSLQLKPSGLHANLIKSGLKNIVVYATGYDDAVVMQLIRHGIQTHQHLWIQPTAPVSNGAALATQPVIQIRDQFNNICTSDSTTIIAATVGNGSWTLGGVLSATAVSGRVVFSGLTATSLAAVTGATLQFTSIGLDSILSSPFVIPDIDYTTYIKWDNISAGTAWYTATNWDPITPSGAWTSTDIVQFQNTGTATTAGINMNTASLSVGAIEITSARTRTLTIGNSSSTPGVLTLNGITLHSVSNIILRNASNNSFTLQDNETGSGKIMGVVLGNAIDNIIQVDGPGDIVISSSISGNNTLTKTGNGTLKLEGANTYSGLTRVLAGTLQLAKMGGATLPTTNSIIINGGVLKISTNQTLTNLTLTNGTLTVDSSDTLFITGSFIYTNGSITGAGNIVYVDSATLIYSGATTQTTTNIEWPVPGCPYSVTIGSAGVNLHANRTISGELMLQGKLAIGSHTLTLGGTISGSGTFEGGNTSDLSIVGEGAFGVLRMHQASATTRTLTNLTVNRTASGTVLLGDSLIILDSLNLHNGVLQTGGLLTLASSNIKTAVIPEIKGSGTISGTLRMEQFITPSGRRWRFMGSPFTNATFEDLRQEIYITGAGVGTTLGTLNSKGFDASGSNQPSVYSYDEPTLGDVNQGWIPLTNSTSSLSNQPIVLGKGYRVFIRGDRSDLGRLSGTNLAQNAVILNLNGNVHTGDFSFNSLLSYTSTSSAADDGWNLVANPYPCAYNWDAFRDDGTNLTHIDSSIWIYDATSGSYKSYNAHSGGSLTNGIIPSGASFWVKANAAYPTMVFKENFKLSTPAVGLFKTSTTDELNIKIELDSVTSDVFIVAHYPLSLPTIDAYDIRKITGAINIYSKTSDGISVTYDARPVISSNDTVQLWVSGGSNTYELRIQSIPNSGKLYYLKDKKLNTIHHLVDGFLYRYSTVSSDTSSFGNRFDLIISSNTVLPVTFFSFKAMNVKNTVALEWSTGSEIESEYFEIQRSQEGVYWETIGKVQTRGNSTQRQVYGYSDEAPVLNRVNHYRIKQLNRNQEARYSSVQSVNLGMNKDAEIILSPNPASTLFTIQTTKPIQTILVKDIQGKIVLHTDKQDINIASLKEGIYIVSIIETDGNVTIRKLHKY